MKLTIDGNPVTAQENETVLECALRHEISIPHLCTHPSLEPFGACRMCVVEIDGMRGYPASCSTPAGDGMVVRTDTPEIRELRKSILGLILLEHPSACMVCDKRDLCEKYRPRADKAGATTGCHTCNNKEVCEIRDLAAELGVSDLPVAPFYRALPIERHDPFIDRDMNLCILCGRCVRICKQQQGEAVIDFVFRGSGTMIGSAFGRSLLEADCRFCGSCVDVCPTGALADRYAKWHGRVQTVTQTTCIYCDAACAVGIETDRGRAVEAGAINADVPICVLGRFAIPEFLNGADRLRLPTVKTNGEAREVEWEEVLQAAADRLNAFVGDAFALVCDSTSTLEDRYVFEKFTREVMKSPHYLEIVPDALGRSRADLPDGVKAVLLTGNFVEGAALDALELLIVQDCYPSAASERADLVLPAAVFAEIDGTVADAGGVRRPLHKACEAPGEARCDWRIVADLAAALAADGFSYDDTGAIAREMGLSDAELLTAPGEAPSAARDRRARRTHFRGHPLDEKVLALKHLPVDEDG